MAVSFMFVLAFSFVVAFFCCRFPPRRSVSVVFAAVVAIFNEAAIFFIVTADFIETIFYIAVIAFCVRYCRLAAVLPEILRFLAQQPRNQRVNTQVNDVMLPSAAPLILN